MVISFAGFKVRIFQAYFENGRMKIQKSNIINFEDGENVEGLKTLIRWKYCQPVGDTRWKKPIKDPYNPWHILRWALNLVPQPAL